MRMRRLSVFARGVMAAICVLSSACAAQRVLDTHSAGAPVAPATARVDVVVQGAVDSELQPLLAALEDREVIQIAARTFWRGRLGGRALSFRAQK